MVDAVTYPICLDILHQPIELPCHAYVCSGCLTEWIRVTVQLKCPCCYSITSLQLAKLKQPPELIIRLLGDIMAHCTSCETDVVARAYNTHSLQHTPLWSAQQATVNDSSKGCTSTSRK